jgi:histone acetyltransferase (RNA polymerase elongator complex component)
MIIPFFIPHSGCPHQCIFCNQKKITGHDTSAECSQLPHLIEARLAAAPGNQPVEIAFFGGSFTALPFEIQRAYLETARPFMASGRIKGIRLSTRPDAITTEVLELLKEHLVETVELGAQSMNDRVLMLSGRGHRAEDTARAVSMLKEQGFKVGIQLMTGLPGDSRDIWTNTVEKTIDLGPAFVRIYPVLVIRDTPLAELYRGGRYSPLSLEETVARCKEALLAFESAGIDVIRIGLQSTEELRKPGTILAGPYHPAFRQLVESSILLDSMKAALEDRETIAPEVHFLVHPGDISNAVGQKRANVAALKKQFRITRIVLRPDPSVRRRTVRLLSS